MNPSVLFVRGHAKRHGGKEIESLRLAGKIVLRREIHLGITLGYCVKNPKCGNQFARVEQFHGNSSAGGSVYPCRDAIGGCPQTRKILRERGDHLEFLLTLRDGGCRKICSGNSTRHSSGCGACQERTTFHFGSSLQCVGCGAHLKLRTKPWFVGSPAMRQGSKA